MNIYDLSYNDILNLPTLEKEKLLSDFLNKINDIPDNIYKDNRKLGDMFSLLELLEDNNISEYTFPGKKVNFYLNSKFIKTSKDFLCPITGDKYKKGSEAYLFKPFFYLPNEKVCYILSKPIKVSYYSSDFLPNNLKEFDIFYYKVNNSYNLNLDEYYNFYVNTGGLTLRKLKR